MRNRFTSTFESYKISAEGLALFRMFFALFTLLVFSPGHATYTSFSEFGLLPDALFDPPTGPFSLLSGFPPAAILRLVELALTVSLFFLFLGYRTRFFSILISALFLYGFGISYSVGKINHNILFILLPALMSFSNWESTWSLDALASRNKEAVSWPLPFLALLTSFAWFTAGISKLTGGWLNPFTQASQGHLFRQFYLRDRQDLLASAFASLDSAFFWEILDYMTVFFEVGFIIAFLSAKRMRLFISLAMIFHLSTMLIMNIVFFAFMIPVYAAFIDWDDMHLCRSAGSKMYAYVRRANVTLLVGGSFVLSLIFHYFGSPLLIINTLYSFTSDMSVVEVGVISIASAFAMANLLVISRNPKIGN